MFSLSFYLSQHLCCTLYSGCDTIKFIVRPLMIVIFQVTNSQYILEVTFLSMLFFFVHVSLEPLVGDLQHLLPLAGSYFHCIQVFETS